MVWQVVVCMGLGLLLSIMFLSKWVIWCLFSGCLICILYIFGMWCCGEVMWWMNLLLLDSSSKFVVFWFSCFIVCIFVVVLFFWLCSGFGNRVQMFGQVLGFCEYLYFVGLCSMRQVSVWQVQCLFCIQNFRLFFFYLWVGFV